jgi:PAS domain S-box-containing protein
VKAGPETQAARRLMNAYGWPLAAVALALLIRGLLNPLLAHDLPFFTLYFSTIFSAWKGGLRPGLLSLVLGLAGGVFLFAEPQFSLQLADPVQLFHQLRFAGVGIAISLICESLHRSRNRLDFRRQLLRSTLASIGDAVITTDAQGRVTSLNEVAVQLTGWTNQEAAGIPLDAVFRIINESSRQSVENPAMKALREGVIVGLANHTLLIAKDGTERPIDDSAAPIYSEKGVLYGCVLVFRDITERKLMEDDLRLVAADLSEANRRKDEFLATLAHELRNPLAPIRNGLQVLRLAGGDAETVEQAHNLMERQLSQLVRLVDDLMDVSRITRGKIELRTRQVPLAHVIHSAIETSRPLIEDMAHKLTVSVPEQTLIVTADLTRLAQVFVNLLNNAAKYSEPGSHIWLTVERQGSDVVVSVKDAGIGIDSEQLPRIFDMFTQIDGSLEKSRGGLGIGLTLVKRLVEMHGGRIEAKSDGPGRGSEFLVRLPVVEASAPEGTNDPAMPAPIESALRILIVDDNQDGANSLTMMLKIMGNDTRTAYDGLQGVEMAEQFRPDVVLLDIGLPRLNGYEACRRIRNQAWGISTILIAMTGWGQDEDRRRSHQAGFDHHLVKPVDPKSLMELLAELQVLKSDLSPSHGAPEMSSLFTTQQENPSTPSPKGAD